MRFRIFLVFNYLLEDKSFDLNLWVVTEIDEEA